MINLIKNFIRTITGSRQKMMIVFLLVVLSGEAFSQEASKIFISDESFDPKSSGQLFIAVDNLNFFKNNEYKSEYASGYTITGTWIRPKLIYYSDKKFRFELGGQVLKYNGRDEYILHPWFAAVYRPDKHITFRMGNLNADQNHRLSDPVMDTEHYLNGKPEAGIQVKFKNRLLKADLWIDWQQMIFKGDPFKERFVFGTVAEFTLIKKDNKSLSIPLTFNGLHEGGEIDTNPAPAQTHIVVSEGIRYDYQTDGTLIKSGRLECSFLQSTYPLHETGLPGNSGYAFSIQTFMNTNYGSFGSGYWQSKNFFTPLGMPLYQNGAIGKTESLEHNYFFVFSYRYNRKIFDHSQFGFTSDLFFNPCLNKLSNNAALYLMINLSILCKKNVD